MDMGRVTLVGRLTRDPKFFGEGDKQRALFSIAFNRGTGDNRKANFIDCIAWGKRADIMRDYAQGTGIFVTGDLEQDNYERTDKDTGETRKVNRIQVNVNSITRTAKRPDTAGVGAGGAGNATTSSDVVVGDSAEIPF